MWDSEFDEEGRSKRNECRRLLLTAGADPDLGPDTGSEGVLVSGLETVLLWGTVVSLSALQFWTYW